MRPHRSVNERLLDIESKLKQHHDMIETILEKLEPNLVEAK